jgi:hypothetical protein
VLVILCALGVVALIIEVLAIVFLEVVVVILVGVANALTHFGHQIIGNYMLCGMRLTFTAFEVASVFSHCAYFAPVSASASGPGV